MARSRMTWFASVAMIALALVACGGGGGGGGSDDIAGTRFEGALGSPGDAAKATRTIELRAGDNLRFMPDEITVKVGETVVFKVVNTASVPHDFTLGDQAVQDEHEKEMQSMSGGGAMNMGDEPNAIHVQPGQTKQVAWTFSKAGTTLYGCHEPGHYAAGMKGTIKVS